MAGMADYYTIETPEPGIGLCFVDISRFCQYYSCGGTYGNYREMKTRYFPPGGALSLYFNGDDFKRINGFKVFKKQIEWMAGKVAVKRLVSSLLSHDVKDRDILIGSRKSGEPYLVDHSDIRISITHSGGYAVAAAGFDNRRVAVDIEKTEYGRMSSIGRIAFSKRELEWLKDKDEEIHYLCWTVKEAYLKIIGKGFAEGLKKVEYLDGFIYHNNLKVENMSVRSSIVSGGYAFTLLYEHGGSR